MDGGRNRASRDQLFAGLSSTVGLVGRSSFRWNWDKAELESGSQRARPGSTPPRVDKAHSTIGIQWYCPVDREHG